MLYQEFKITKYDYSDMQMIIKTETTIYKFVLIMIKIFNQGRENVNKNSKNDYYDGNDSI